MELPHTPYPQVLADPKAANGQAPIVVVYHRHDGQSGWHMLSEFEDEAAECPANADLELDESLAAVLDLPVGWMARRASASAPWMREPIVGQDLEPFS